VRHAIPQGALACTESWYGLCRRDEHAWWEFCRGFSRLCVSAAAAAPGWAAAGAAAAPGRRARPGAPRTAAES
jgi:hypothetical protein